MTSPNEEEINLVANKLNIPVDFIKDALDDEERSRIEREDNNVLIIVDFPYITHDDTGIPIYETIPIGMIITDDCFITVSLKETPILGDFYQNKIKGFFTNKKRDFPCKSFFQFLPIT